MHKGLVLTLLVLTFNVVADDALLLRYVDGHAAATATLGKKTIDLVTQGEIELDYRDAKQVLFADDALTILQDAYARTLEKGKKPEFVIQHIDGRRYYYVNKKKRRTGLEEVYRDGDDHKLEAVYFITSKRWFGRFDAVIHFTAEARAKDKLAYTARVYAFPRVGAIRFAARNLKLIERFFAAKTHFFESLLTDVFREATTGPNSAQKTSAMAPVQGQAP